MIKSYQMQIIKLILIHYEDQLYFRNALSLVWSGLVLADQEDTCSYRWPNVCTTPDWVVFQTGTSSPDTSRLCGAVDNNLNHVMRQCNESLKYICELETNGKLNSG